MSWFWGRSPAAGAGSSSGGAGQGKPGDNDPPKVPSSREVNVAAALVTLLCSLLE